MEQSPPGLLSHRRPKHPRGKAARNPSRRSLRRPLTQRRFHLGQTKAQVVASFGEPKKIATLGAKQFYYYQDLKVMFVNGKVTDVQ